MGRNTMHPINKHEQNIKKLRDYLVQKPRDLLLFECLLVGGITTKQILSLKVADLATSPEKASPNSSVKNGGPALLQTPEIQYAYNLVRRYDDLTPDDFLFKSRKGGKQLSVSSVSRLVRGWLNKLNLHEYKSIHDMRTKFRHPGAEVPEPDGETNTLRTLSVVKNLTVQETAYRELAKSILNGNILPGQKLLPDKIARRMEISTTPVREALRRLEVKGFVVHHPKKGWVVNKLSREGLREILDMRLLLECEAIYRAATAIRSETLDELEMAKQEYDQANIDDDIGASLKANRKFHMLAYRDAGSSIMFKTINELWDIVSPYYQILFSQSLLPKPTVGRRNHAKIFDSLQNKDPEQARYWIKEDIVKPAEFVIKLFDLYEKSFQ